LDEQQLTSEITKIFRHGPIKLLYLDSCESTNIECLKLSADYAVVIAEHQTAGRGRRGNNWHSPLSQNIYCSIGLNKPIKAEYLGLISLLVGLCIVKVLRAMGVDEVNLKWPNDILLQGKKLGGILIETRATSPDNFYLVIGFGLNINLANDDLKSIGQPAISLNQHLENSLDRQQLIISLIGQILYEVNKFELNRIDGLIAEYNQYDIFIGRHVLVKTASEELSGIHRGIQRTGQIQVETSRGLELFSAAEISLREIK